jgi:TonB family protein
MAATATPAPGQTAAPAAAGAATSAPYDPQATTRPVDAAAGPANTQQPAPSLPPTTVAGVATRRHHQSRILGGMTAVSTLLHAGAVLAFVLWPQAGPKPVDLDEAVVKARLVKLGKPRDEQLLPRLPGAPPPPPPQKPTPELKQPEKPAEKTPTAPAEVKPSAADILNRLRDEKADPRNLQDLIKSRVGEQTDEGQLDGDRDGTALEGEITKSYFARVTARIQASMEVSLVLTDDEMIRLKAILCMTIGEDGQARDFKVKTSGSQVFDSDVLAAGRRASPLPAPPPQARAQVQSDVCFNVCPKSCS